MDMILRGMERDQIGDKTISAEDGRNLYIQYTNAITRFDLSQLHVDELSDTMKNDVKLLRCCN